MTEKIYRGFPFISYFKSIVTSQLKHRAQNRYVAKSTFIKMTPGYSYDGKESSKMVLKSILNTVNPRNGDLKSLYSPSHGNRPLPGIKSLTLSYKNVYGSIRKATVEWSCHTLTDLQQLSRYFLNPGLTTLIEWGWNTGTDLLNTYTSNKDGVNDINIYTYHSYVDEKIKSNNCNYDAMIGVITNYNWSLNDNGGYDCTTEVESIGVLMEGITVSSQKSMEHSDEENAPKPSEITTLSSLLENGLYNLIKKHYDTYRTPSNDHDYFIYAHGGGGDMEKYNNKLNLDDDGNKTKDQKASEENSKPLNVVGRFLLTAAKGVVALATGNAVLVPMYATQVVNEVITLFSPNLSALEFAVESPMYISWGFIEDFIINPCISMEEKQNSNELLSFDSREIKISNHSNLRTTDLSMCVVPQHNDYDKTPKISMDDFKFIGGDTTNEVYNYGYVRRLMVNTEMFRQTMLQSDKLLDGVTSVFSKISNACASYWNFKIMTDETDVKENTLNNNDVKNGGTKSQTYSVKSAIKCRVVDVNYVDIFPDANSIYLFRTKSFGIKTKENTHTSVVKNITFESRLPEAAKLNIFYSSQRKENDTTIIGFPGSNAYYNLFKPKVGSNFSDRFALRLKDNTQNRPEHIKNTEDGDTTSLLAEKENGFNGTELLNAHEKYPDALKKYLPLRTFGYKCIVKIIGNDTDRELSGIQGMKNSILMKDGKYEPLKEDAALIPIECGVEIEGISGIRMGDVFSVDSIPDVYLDKGYFQVIGIDDIINNSYWSTKIKGSFRPYKINGKINRNKIE